MTFSMSASFFNARIASSNLCMSVACILWSVTLMKPCFCSVLSEFDRTLAGRCRSFLSVSCVKDPFLVSLRIDNVMSVSIFKVCGLMFS